MSKWQLHAATSKWMKQLGPDTRGWWCLEECDVADCFLNTPREAVLAAVEYWLHKTQQCTRAQPCFTICKDGKAGDHRGRPASIHFWSDAAEQLFAACVRDLNNNDLSEAQAGADWVVLRRRKGFSIGGTSLLRMWSWWRHSTNICVSGLPPWIPMKFQ